MRAEDEISDMHAPSESEAAAPRGSRESGRSKGQAFELKGMVAPLTVLRLRTTDVAVINKQLRTKVAQMPQFFQDAPVLLDLGGLGDDASRLPFGELASVLRTCKMVPVAITNADEDARTRAASAGFGYVAPPAPKGGGRAAMEIADPTPAERAPVVPVPVVEAPASVRAATPEAAPARREAPAPQPVRVVHRPPMVIRQPVRSGQIIYAEGTDLVVLAPVNPGAEVIADGHVHIYSTLRGRAVAGAQGMTDARIFCQKLDAELVAISGAYLLSEDLPAECKGKPAQINLENGVCKVSPL
jgi:septum site-determining protein MinC